MLLMTLRLPVALSVSFADSSPTGGAKSTPVGAGQAVVRLAGFDGGTLGSPFGGAGETPAGRRD